VLLHEQPTEMTTPSTTPESVAAPAQSHRPERPPDLEPPRALEPSRAAERPSEPRRQRWADFDRAQLLELVTYQGDLLQALLAVLLARGQSSAPPGRNGHNHQPTLEALENHLATIRAQTSNSSEPATHSDLDSLLDRTRQLLREVEAGLAAETAGRAASLAAPPARDHQIDRRMYTLSGREREVMERLVAGQSSVDIGIALGISDTTVRTYRARVMRKLEVNNFADLIKLVLGYRTTIP